MTVLPSETDSKSLVDAHAVLSSTIARQLLQTIPRGSAEVPQISGPIQLIEFSPQDPPQRLRASRSCPPTVHTVEQVAGGSVREGAYHVLHYNGYRYSCKSPGREGLFHRRVHPPFFSGPPPAPTIGRHSG